MVPCTVAEVVAPGRLAVVLVDPATGEESTGRRAAPTTSWPGARGTGPSTGCRSAPGSRSAWPATWRGATSSRGCAHGILLAVDYGHTAGERPAGGTLTAYRDGALVAPVPDGSCDLTAHVAVDSLEHDELTTQRAALRDAGARRRHSRRTTSPAPTRPATSPPSRGASAVGALTAPDGLGGFAWVLRRVQRM